MSQMTTPYSPGPLLACTAILAHHGSDRPPLLLLHGAANSAAVWTFWQQELAAHGWSSYALDLRGHGRSQPVDLAGVSMAVAAGRPSEHRWGVALGFSAEPTGPGKYGTFCYQVV